MIMARVDRLSDGARAVLQAGSAIEREFPHELIRTVGGLTEAELLTHLSAIKDAELLYESGIYPRTSYIFRHALTREVVYGSILARKRKELHSLIGSAIEALHKDDLAEHYEILSEHFSRAEDYRKAAEYAKRAARKAERSASMPDAIVYARKRVLYAEKLSGSSEIERDLIDARTVLGQYLSQINRYVEARDAVEPIARLAREKGYRKRLCQIQSVIGAYFGYVDEDFPKALTVLDEVIRIAGEEKDFITLIMASAFSGVFQTANCDFEEARKSLQRAVDINKAAKSLWGIASQKSMLAYCTYWFPGSINDCTALSSEALKIAQKSGDPISRGISHTAYGSACYARGQLEDAENHCMQGRNLLVSIDMPGWAGVAHSMLGETYFEMKKYLKSRECYDQAFRSYESGPSFPSWARWARLGVSRCEVMLGQKDVDLESLRSVHGRNRVKAAEGHDCRYLGEILLNLGGSHIHEAEQWMRKAIEADDRNGMMFSLGLDHALYGEYFMRQGAEARHRKNSVGRSISSGNAAQMDGWRNTRRN
jgi:tetratricopeptide (TPR) repeat protein